MRPSKKSNDSPKRDAQTAASSDERVTTPPNGRTRSRMKGCPKDSGVGPTQVRDPKLVANEPKTAEVAESAKSARDQHTRYQAETLRSGYLPATMTLAHRSDGHFEIAAFREYLDEFLRDAGNPTNPVVRCMIEQLAFANLRVGDLHAQAALATAPEMVKVLTAAAVRLLGELRRTALALHEMEKPEPRRQTARLSQVG